MYCCDLTFLFSPPTEQFDVIKGFFQVLNTLPKTPCSMFVKLRVVTFHLWCSQNPTIGSPDYAENLAAQYRTRSFYLEFEKRNKCLKEDQMCRQKKMQLLNDILFSSLPKKGATEKDLGNSHELSFLFIKW